MSFVRSFVRAFTPKPKPPKPPKPQIQKAAVKAAPKGPTTLEVAADNKRRGRKATMLTSPTGATQDYTLSKKTLLG
tara:strand:- start:456 stop:683 length:228 start_codon:yes stop_codon:yes gene_type:complete